MTLEKRSLLPIAIINYLARLGWASGDKEKFTLEELVELFNLNSLNKSSSIFDYKKLYSLNKYFIKELQINDLYTEFKHHTKKFDSFDEDKLMEIIEAQRDRCKTIKDIVDESQFFLSDNFDIDDKLKAKFLVGGNSQIFNVLITQLESENDWCLENIQAIIEKIIKSLELDTPKFAKPVRVALTGSLSSPSIDTTIYLLGKSSCLKRLKAAKTLIT